MKKTGSLLKMQTQLQEEVQYHLPIGEDSVYLNDLIGQTIKLTYENAIYCIKCGRKTVKSFNQGFCYPCFRDAPEAADWIIHPEKSQAHLGIEDRDLEYEKSVQLQPHVVYLSLTSGLKVGITRHTQVPTRWIDQGASQAIKLAETPNRYLAGMIEVSLKKHLEDKTNWQQMLKNVHPNLDLIAEKEKVKQLVDAAYHEYILPENEIINIHFPVLHYPVKVKSIGFEKVPEYEGKLVGIKGQYLLFENGIVLNIRKYAGFVVSLES
ncbi:MAG TPA: DUF2797 domain-containing protein [Vicingaceae bacterium]|nr:DUF2797 domain-containing protein [Vicingaceae bacterium]